MGFMFCFNKGSGFLLSMYYHLSIADKVTETQRGEVTYLRTYS